MTSISTNDAMISMWMIVDKYYHLAASDDSDDSDDNGLIYGYQSPIRSCHRIAPRHCPVGSLSTQSANKPHPHPRAFACRSGVGLASGTTQPTCWCTAVSLSTFCSLANLLTSLACLPVTPSHHLHSELFAGTTTETVYANRSSHQIQ